MIDADQAKTVFVTGAGLYVLSLRSAGLKLKPAKCHFLMASCLPRHAVSENGIATGPEKIQDVVSWFPPSSVTQVRDYLRFCLYYSCFIGNFLEIANPLPPPSRQECSL